jgi:hypothetical protein
VERAKAAIWTPVKEGILNSASGSIGSRTRCWITTKPRSRTAEPAKSVTISALPQPSSLPRKSASTSRKSAALKVATPGQSTWVASGSRLSPSRRWVIAIAAMPIGTLR